ncbi:hypothetical protein [Streptomyces sp. NPDC127066]|uniref:hypothetical protein n=1 Tax=Streptomyces sp. NPDC127066 TaxID=3347125 RepID=UPI003646BAD1
MISVTLGCTVLATATGCGNDDPPPVRSDGIHSHFADVTGKDVRSWVAKSPEVSKTTKALVSAYVERAEVTPGFRGCGLAENENAPELKVEVNFPQLSNVDTDGLAEQRKWAQDILETLEEFAHTFTPGRFIEDEGWSGISDNKWRSEEPSGGGECSGEISLWGSSSPAAVNVGLDYQQSANKPVE